MNIKKTTDDHQVKVIGSGELVAGDRIELSVVKDKKGKPSFASKVVDFDVSARCNPTVRFARTKKELPELHEDEIWTGKISEVVMTKKIIPLKGMKRVVVFVFVEDLTREEETRIFFDKKRKELVRETKSGKRVLKHDAIPASKEVHVMKYEDKLINVGYIYVCGQVVMRTHEGIYKSSMTLMAEKLIPFMPQKKVELTKYMYEKLGHPYSTWDKMEELYVNLPAKVPQVPEKVSQAA